MSSHLLSPAFWSTITRFGEAGVLLPCAALIAVGLVAATRELRTALPWVLALGAAVALTTATKIAFLGFGLGIARLDFTGVSGHSMFAAAVYPMLAWSLLGRARPAWRGLAVAAAYAFAAVVAMSRYWMDAHSLSEIVLGFGLGALASAATMAVLQRGTALSLSPALAVAAAAWLAFMPHEPVIFPSHEIVTRVSLRLSGRAQPFTRADLHRRAGKKTPGAFATGVFEDWRMFRPSTFPT